MGLFATIHMAFHEPETRLYRVVNTIVWVLIVASIVVLGAEPFFLDSPSQVTDWLILLDEVMLAIFALEVSLRILSFRPPDLEVFKRAPLGAVRTAIVERLKYAMQPMNVITTRRVNQDSRRKRMRRLRMTSQHQPLRPAEGRPEFYGGAFRCQPMRGPPLTRNRP